MADEEDDKQDDDKQDIPPTAEELKALREKAAKSEELENKVKTLEEDEQNRNWKKSREKEKRILAALKASGKEVDDDGNVISGARAYTEEELNQRVTAQVEKTHVDKAVSKAEKALADTDRPIFRKAWEKATHGETVNSDNVESLLEQAMMLAGRGTTAGVRGGRVSGGPPVFEEKKDNFADNPTGKSLANAMGLKTESTKK